MTSIHGLDENESAAIAGRWCTARGNDWSVKCQLGTGGTAPVFEVQSPDGPRALKIYDARFSSGKKGEIEEKRIDQQLELKGHDCPHLVQIYDGGRFEERLFVLMSRASGLELEKCLKDIPRVKIRTILDQVTRATIYLRGRGLCHRDIKAANIFVSEDFDHCTLLDISVIREVNDPVGIGTDHDGQLPVVATARYSPPEYLFRLLEPSPDLWHALNVYQLGALLHDLIMKEPLFEAEYEKSKENRYRFAWIIATSDPSLSATDVDYDLLFTARRALDKNWERRSQLKLEDFLADANVWQEHALQVLGLGMANKEGKGDWNVSEKLGRIANISCAVESGVNSYLRTNGITAKHTVGPGANDLTKLVRFQWEGPTLERASKPPQIELRIDLRLLTLPNGGYFDVTVTLASYINDTGSSIDLSGFPDRTAVDALIVAEVVEALKKLAVANTRM